MIGFDERLDRRRVGCDFEAMGCLFQKLLQDRMCGKNTDSLLDGFGKFGRAGGCENDPRNTRRRTRKPASGVRIADIPVFLMNFPDHTGYLGIIHPD